MKQIRPIKYVKCDKQTKTKGIECVCGHTITEENQSGNDYQLLLVLECPDCFSQAEFNQNETEYIFFNNSNIKE